VKIETSGVDDFDLGVEASGVADLAFIVTSFASGDSPKARVPEAARLPTNECEMGVEEMDKAEPKVFPPKLKAGGLHASEAAAVVVVADDVFMLDEMVATKPKPAPPNIGLASG